MRSNFGTIQKHGNAYRIFWTESGRKRSRVIRGSRSDAIDALARIRLEVTGRADRDMTYARYWSAAVEPTLDGLELKTIAGYRQMWRYLTPYIANRTMSSTTAAFAERALANFTPSVAHACYRLWNKVLNMAYRDEIIDHNPLERGVKLPLMSRNKKTLYAAEYVPILLEAIRGLKYEPIILCELGGGLRHEEACALAWEDITEWNGYALVSVSKALVDVNGSKCLKGTKNGFSERECVLGEPFASRLLELKATGPLVPSRVAGPVPYMSSASITKEWHKWCEATGTPYVMPKNLRATFATLHGECGSPDSLVSGAMGHADATTKARNYQAITRRGLALIADNLAEYISDSTKSYTFRVVSAGQGRVAN